MSSITYKKAQEPREFCQCTKLATFLVSHQEYLYDACKVVLAYRSPDDYARLSWKDYFKGLSSDPSDELKSLFDEFYNTNVGELKVRRGSFMENLMERVGCVDQRLPQTKYRECRILCNGKQIWRKNKNVDFLYEFAEADVEAHECKIDLSWTIWTKDPKDMEKLEFLEFLPTFYAGKKGRARSFLPTLAEPSSLIEQFMAGRGITVVYRAEILRRLAG